MDVSVWATISRLLDEALDLPPADRLTWLERLGAEHEPLKPRLRAMIERASTEDDGFLAALPNLSALEDEAEGLSLGAGEAGGKVGPYRLIRELASGGQGSVWLAERADGLLTRPVAVKLPIGLRFRPHLAERVAREREILGSLTHPHIARLYDAGFADDGSPYLAMEYVDGAAIDRHSDERALDVAARVRLFIPVIRAVAFAHGRLVIHRDLKPSNVLVTPAGEARLLDFGIARILDEARPQDSTLTEAGGRAMTLRYASPEQVAQAPLGVTTDVYSLGVMLYELLTGVSPYRPARDTVAALEEAVLAAEPVRPSAAAADPARRRRLRGDLDTILVKALKKDPAERYGTADDFADDLEHYLVGRPVVAQPDRRFYRARKFVARHRVEVAGATAALLAVLAGASVAVWQARIARTEQVRAEAVKDFIASIFRDVDPNLRGEGRPVTANDVLQLARERVQSELGDEPEARAELMRILGESLMSIGSPGPAADLLRAALAEARRQFGPDAPEAIDTALLLAAAGQYDAKSDEALTLVGDVLGVLERTNRRDTEAYVRAKLIRARVLASRGRADADLETSAQQALDASVAVLGPRHLVTADALGTASVAYRVRGKRDLALQNAERSYAAYLEAHGNDPKHPRIIAAQNMLGRALYDMDRTPEAIQHLKAAAANGAEVYRENGLYVQQLLGTLANIQLAYGEVKDAVANLEQAMRADLGGARVSDTYMASQDWVRARAYVAAARPADAVPLYERAVARLRTLPPGRFLRTVETEYAGALLELGRLREARAVLEPLFAASAAPLGVIDRQVLVYMAWLDRREGRSARALERLANASAFTPDSPTGRMAWVQAKQQAGDLLLDLRRFAEAEGMLEQADTMLQSLQGVTTPLRASILMSLGRAVLAQGRAADALPHLESAHAFWNDFDKTHPNASAAARWLDRARAEASL